MPPLPAHSSGGDGDGTSAGPLYRPDPSNTRVLLRSLEDLRDSLSARVEQLSGAVERLRGQAGELEHAVNTGTALAPGFGRPAPSGRIAPLVTTFTTVSRSYARPLSLAARIERPREAGGSERVGSRQEVPLPRRERYNGRQPTNLDLVASQPQPIIVKTLKEAEDEAEAEESSTERVAPEDPQQAPTRPSSPPRIDSPLDRFDPAPETVLGLAPFPVFSQLPPGLTTRGMMVQERQVPSEARRRTPVHTETDRTARDAERLDRAIARYQRRLDESQREFHSAWEHERHRGLEGGRMPNEHSVARAEAMRRHVDNAHRLWNLIYQRDRLPGADRDPEHDVSDSPLADGMRHILGTSPSFLRRNLPHRRRRVPSGVGVPALPPRPTAAEMVALERGWIDRIESERAGIPTEPTADEFEFEFYRDFLFQDRQRRRAARTTGTDDGDWPAQRLRMLERLSRLRAWREEGDVFPRDEPVREDAPTRSSTSPPHSPHLAPLSPTDSLEFTPLSPPPPLFVERDTTGNWRANRTQLLNFIEESRDRVHSMARDLSPDMLAEERPGMRRVLEGIERMLARDSLGSDVRVRLERLAARERELLGDPPQAAIVPRADTPNLEPAPVLQRLETMLAREGLPPSIRQRLENLATLERERGSRTVDLSTEPTDVLERIDRARARVRELSRISQELASVRADMGLDEEPRARPRRDSDADTVVPSNWSTEETPLRLDDAFRVLSLDGHEVIDLGTERVDEPPPDEDKEESESGQLEAGEWVLPPTRRPRPYVSLLDL